MKSTSLLALAFMALCAVVGLPQSAETSPPAFIETLSLSGDDWAAGQGFAYALADEGIVMDGVGLTAVYTTAPIESPFPFNAVVPGWQADLPDGAALEIAIRTAVDANAWSDWYDIHSHNDWTLPGDAITTGDMVAVPAANGTHRWVQVRVMLTREAADAQPRLSLLRLTFIDSTAGPTIAEMQAQQAELDAERQGTAVATNFPRPAAISRAVWCIYDTCDDLADLVYQPVTHLIVHHTVTDNGYANAADVVRAIYLFHRDTQDWGDIGYNYLIDRSGVIFEGHMNEDFLNLDVVGIHAGEANSGSLGVALIGTFTTPDEYQVSDTPPAAMRSALADLFAWKADQRGIAIYDASRPVNMAWGLPHVMSHRDVYGGANTLCPGGNAHAYLPWLRTAVSQRIGQVSPYTFVSETSAAFTRSNNTWYEPPGGCGWQGHAYYTWSVSNPAQSTHWGQWRLTIPQAGAYEIQVYAPYCYTQNSETNGARYQITHDGVTETVVVSHEANVGLWMSLGTFALPAGPNTTVRLTDLTTTDSGVGVWFDDVRFRPVDTATISGLSPANGVWANQTTVNFSWEFDLPTLVYATQVEVATDAAFANVVAAQSWPTAVTQFSHTFAQDYPALFWRVTATNQSGSPSVSPVASFGLDSTPPESVVTAVYTTTVDTGYLLLWQGQDNLAGVAAYTIQYQAEGDVGWTDWLTSVAHTSAHFSPPNPGQVYYFRSQAVDWAGNLEAPHATADISTDQAIALPHVIMLPIIQRN
ncbi:MAG: N-acetylmuramoyl-L-alanine amidase [Chloroflexi bacterium]|nr:N-acetylmuramoyl-L-alanine amidase [Chloroflexota bacterium]